MKDYLAHNRHAWNRRRRLGLNHTTPADQRWFENIAKVADVHGWLPKPLKGLHILCLAAGGGRHGPVYASAGAHVTVVDLSPDMLELDRAVAAERGLQVETVETSMDNLGGLGRDRFDIVIQPVSTCYVPDLERVYGAVAEVIKPGGLYVSQHKQPASLQAATAPESHGYLITEPYHRPGPLPIPEADFGHREAGCQEFIHGWEALLGKLCRAGFVVEDLLEPNHADRAAPPGSFAHRCLYLPPFVAVKARRVGPVREEKPRLWIP